MDLVPIGLLVSAAVGLFGPAPAGAGSHVPDPTVCPHCLLGVAVIRIVTQMEAVVGSEALRDSTAGITAAAISDPRQP
jgi:hypothetical protein